MCIENQTSVLFVMCIKKEISLLIVLCIKHQLSSLDVCYVPMHACVREYVLCASVIVYVCTQKKSCVNNSILYLCMIFVYNWKPYPPPLTPPKERLKNKPNNNKQPQLKKTKKQTQLCSKKQNLQIRLLLRQFHAKIFFLITTRAE